VVCLLTDAMQPPSSNFGDFDVIVCNPPYIPTGDIDGLDPSVRNYEPRLALDGGADGLDYYRAIAERWSSALRLDGTLAFEVGLGQVGQVEMLLAKNGFSDIKTYQDTAGIWRVVEGTMRK
jgi:release factor glutamine methyltransferase